MGNLNKKIDNLTKIVILLLLVVVIQLIFNGFMIYRDLKLTNSQAKLEEEPHPS